MIGRREIAAPVSDEPELKGFDDFDLKLGDVMRGERATLGKSLLDVQRELKIKAAYIAAIENSDPSAFETQGFVAGYVRSYARFLGLDPEWAYSRFCKESNFATTDGMTHGAATKKAKPHKAISVDPLADPDAVFIPRSEGLLSRVEPGALGSILVLVMLISALGYGGWSIFREVQKVDFVPVDQAPGVGTEVDVLAPEAQLADAGGSPDMPGPTVEAMDRLYRPTALDVPVIVARDAPIATLDPREVGTLAPVAVEPQPEVVLAEITPSLAPIDEQTAPQVVETAPPEVVLFAVRPSWVRVQSVDGTVLFEKILDAGEEYVLPATEEPPVLRAGNAGSVYFAVNGQTFGPAGNGPAVVKNLSLGSEQLIAAFEPADPAADADLARFIAVADASAEAD